jgi:hypothetical protein
MIFATRCCGVTQKPTPVVYVSGFSARYHKQVRRRSFTKSGTPNRERTVDALAPMLIPRMDRSRDEASTFRPTWNVPPENLTVPLEVRGSLDVCALVDVRAEPQPATAKIRTPSPRIGTTRFI